MLILSQEGYSTRVPSSERTLTGVQLAQNGRHTSVFCLFSRKAFFSHYGFSSHRQSKGDSVVNSKRLKEVISSSFQPWLDIGLEAAISSLLLVRKLRHAIVKHAGQRAGKRGIRSWTHLLGIPIPTLESLPHELTKGWTQTRLNLPLPYKWTVMALSILLSYFPSHVCVRAHIHTDTHSCPLKFSLQNK